VSDAAPTRSTSRRILWLIPLALFAALATLFFIRLFAGDPSRLPSALIGKPAPQTSLDGIEGLLRDGKPVPGLSPETLKGHITLVNVWASWCDPCRDEAPLLMQLAENGVRLVGINQRDKAENARRFLGRYGNPFVAIGTDANARASIEWGVYGVPETFVVDREGKIVFKLVGGLTPENYERQIKPALERAKAGQ
jgi:cytochrome c biogenesis protein CcmG, thiol:disulfide interchange protein DsbE